jgi:hypothetical protein
MLANHNAGRMIELLKIHALVRAARVLVFVGGAAEGLSLACRRRAGHILDDATIWLEARDAARAAAGEIEWASWSSWASYLG